MGKPKAPAYHSTLTFDRYPFNSMSKVYVNLVYWISLNPKKSIYPTFLGQTPHFLGEKLKKKRRATYTVAVFLSLMLGV